MPIILKLTDENIAKVLAAAKETVLEEGVSIYPTDTVYGIGGNAHSWKAVERIKKIKERMTDAPFSVIMADMRMIKKYCETGDYEEAVLKKYLPGPYTFLLKCRRALPVSTNRKIGVRIPDAAFACRLAGVCGMPVITTSANLSGKPPPAGMEEIDKGILEAVDLVIDGGKTKHKGASTVVDLVEKKVIRSGVGRIEI